MTEPIKQSKGGLVHFIPTHKPKPTDNSDFLSYMKFDSVLRCPKCRQSDMIISNWAFNEEVGCDELLNKCHLCGTTWISLRGNNDKIMKWFFKEDNASPT